MKFSTDIIINWSVDTTFDAMKSPAMMQKVAWPLVVFKPVSPSAFPERWHNDATYVMKMFLFGFLPMGWQKLKISSEYDQRQDTYILKDVGPGFAVKWWDHKVALKEITRNSTHYEEQLTLTAGLMAPLIWLGMTALFWWRKRRWLQLTKGDLLS